MGIMEKLEKSLFKLIVGMIGFITIAFIVMTICCGPFGSANNATFDSIQTHGIAPTTVQDSDVKDRITTRFDGREEHVKCKVLIVPTNHNTIYIENDDIEVISVIGNGNMIAYPDTANPEIRNVGSYNEIWDQSGFDPLFLYINTSHTFHSPSTFHTLSSCGSTK